MTLKSIRVIFVPLFFFFSSAFAEVRTYIEDVSVESVRCSQGSDGFKGEASLRGSFFLELSLGAVVPDNVVTVAVNSEDACDLLIDIHSSDKRGQVVFSRGSDPNSPRKFVYALFAVMYGRNLILNN